MSLIAAVVLVVPTLLFLTEILTAFGASGQTLTYAYDFMLVTLLGLPVTYVFFNLNHVMRATGYPKKAMGSTLLSVGINIILAPIFIFWFKWGITGAALATLLAQVTGMGDNPSLSELIGPVKVMLQAYDEGRLDKLYIVSNKFINTMSQVPTISQLLPLPASDDDDLKHKSWDYLYEPDPKALLDTLLRRYVESQVYQGVVENLASEQAARMVAMKAATDNGGSLIKELQLVYNKARQASITQELTEIVSGAAAV